MKILFSADWHIKLGQKNVPISWARERYYSFFQQIHNLEEQVDLHIIGGDIFDRLPTLEELELYYDFISDISVDTILYPGNHEATKKNKTFLDHLKKSSIQVNGLIQIVTECFENEYFSILPYNDLHKKGIFKKLSGDKPLFTHVRGEIPPHVHPEVPLENFDKFPIVFAGDLHAHSNTQRNIVYPGSPMTIEFHRKEVKTGYLIINFDSNKATWKWHKFELPQLIRKTVSTQGEMVPTRYNHTIYELEGNLTELANVKNSDLLDKKVVKRSSEVSLILDNMTPDQELEEYLTYVLELPESEIKETMKVHNDYS